MPHAYQERGVEHLVENPVAALFFDPGLGKTSITLAAFDALRERGVARRMLVVAPLRVCQLVWRQEAEGWTQFRHLRFSLVHGTPKQKQKALEEDADIYLINPEGIAWLSKQYRFRAHRFPFDTVVVDELTKFKNGRSQRSKLLRPLMAKVARRWGLTGTPIPNGYMDLHGQMLILDDGRALGEYITHYRNRYFQQGYTGFDWGLRNGAGAQIEERIRPYVLRGSAEDYLDLPRLLPDVREIELAPKEMAMYRQLKQEMLVKLPEGEVVTAENAGGVYSKLKQMANGAVYIGEGAKRKHVVLHTAKLDALEELVDELQGKQLLVGYEFRHDLERLKERFPNAAVLGSGVSAARAMEIERDWNNGTITLLFAHPASVGHGLNFQKSHAGHICWFSTTIDLELYEQFLKRILRQGNNSEFVVNHALVVMGTVDALSIDTIDGKAFTQARFLRALRDELSDDQGGNDMALRKPARMRRKAEVEESEADAPAAKTRGWKKAEEDEEDEDGEEEEAPRRKRRGVAAQREDVKSRLSGDEDEDEAEAEGEEEDEAPRRKRRSGFSGKVKARLEDEDGEEEEAEEEDEAPKPRRRAKAEAEDEDEAPARKPRRRAKAEAEEEDDDVPFDGAVASDAPAEVMPSFESPEDRAYYRRVRALELVAAFADKLGLRSPNDAVKAAEVFEKYLKD